MINRKRGSDERYVYRFPRVMDLDDHVLVDLEKDQSSERVTSAAAFYRVDSYRLICLEKD